MAQTIRQRYILTFNPDGKRHPVQERFTAVTLLLGMVAVATVFFPNLHLVSSWAGLAGIVVGLWSQFISATTGERLLTVIGLGASGIGFFIGMAHGGLFGTGV